MKHGRLIDADALEEKVEHDYHHKKINRYDRDLLLHYLDVEMAPAIEPERSRIEKELHGLTPKQQYNFLDSLMHKKSVGWNSSALYVTAWLAGEED